MATIVQVLQFIDSNPETFPPGEETEDKKDELRERGCFPYRISNVLKCVFGKKLAKEIEDRVGKKVEGDD